MRNLIILLAILSFPALASEDQWYLGDWKISGAKFAPFSAINDQEAAEWFGHIIHYGEKSVESPGEACSDPVYDVEVLSASEFMERNRTSSDYLEIRTSMVETIAVSCDGIWMGPGRFIIRKDEDSGYIVMDGVYFMITRI